MKKPRLPRYSRVDNPPRLVLTNRDREILRQVYLFRLMTREQIERLLFPPHNGQDHPTLTSRCRKRLKLLYHHSLLERIPVPSGAGLWAWRPVYRLAANGAKLIASELGTSISKLAYWGKNSDTDHRSTGVSLLFIEHALKINDVRIAIVQEAIAQAYRLEKWIDDTKLKSQEMKDYVTTTSPRGQSERVAVIPDAYFVLNLGNRRAHFFLELDRATMSNKRWKTRILAYRAYVESGKYQKRYQTRSLRVLTVTTTHERLANIKKTTEDAGGDNLFWFTTFDQAVDYKILSSPIWYVAGRPETATLVT